MEKEKQIEEMARALCRLIKDGDIKGCESCYFRHDGYECTCKYRKYAIQVHDAGYGNVKEAVKDFAEKLKKKFIRLEKKYGDEADRDKNTIPNLLFGFYKPVVEREVAFANGQATMANKAQDMIDELIKEVCGEK